MKTVVECSGVESFRQARNRLERRLLSAVQRAHLSGPVMNQPYCARKTELHRPAADGDRVFWDANGASQHRVDIHLELCILGEPGKLFIQYFQTLFGGFVWQHIVDAD